MLIFQKKVLWYPRHKKVARDRGGINSGVALGRWVWALFGWLLRRERGDKKRGAFSVDFYGREGGGNESILKWAIRAGSDTGNFLGIEKKVVGPPPFESRFLDSGHGNQGKMKQQQILIGT